MTAEFQTALSVTATVGMALLLMGLSLARRRREPISSRLSSVMDAVDALATPAQPPEVGEEPPAAGGLRVPPQADRLILASRIGIWLQRRLASAGLGMTVSEYLILHMVIGALGATLALAATGQPLLVLACGLGGLYLPWWYLESRRTRRREDFSIQLADTVSLLVSALRAGQSLSQALERVARESSEPTAGEMRRVVREMKMGLPMGSALQKLASRVGSRDLDLLVTALDVQREVGGDPVPLLESMGDVARERQRVRAEVQVITSQQRLAARVLFLMPLLVAVLLFLINPGYMAQIFSPERLLCGLPVFLMPATGLMLLVAGYVAVRRAARVDM